MGADNHRDLPKIKTHLGHDLERSEECGEAHACSLINWKCTVLLAQISSAQHLGAKVCMGTHPLAPRGRAYGLVDECERKAYHNI